MKKAYKELRFINKNKKLIENINMLIDEYSKQGYTFTLRQLYYQLVSRDIIGNTTKEYNKLSILLGNARMGGYTDWDSIEDRVRIPKIPYYVKDIEDAIQDTINQYRLNRMEGQKNYIEVWIEKDALSGVFYPVTSEYHILLMVNRGYSSISAMHEAYLRFSRYENPVILYFGDHDPSGLDMIRDIRERLSEFGTNVRVLPIALNMNQIKEFNPPPNPAKISDPRAKWYLSKFGNISWELDALPPDILGSLAENTIKKLIDMDKYNSILLREERDKKTIENSFK